MMTLPIEPPAAVRPEPRGPVASAPGMLSEVELVLARFRLLASRRSAWLQHLWSQEGTASEAGAISHAEVAQILADRDSPEAEARWLADCEPARAWAEELVELENALAAVENSRLSRLAEIFGLGPADLDLLQACVALAWDPALVRVAAYLHDQASRTAMTEHLAARLYGRGRSGLWPATSALFVWDLVRVRESGPGEPRALECDPQIRDWLRGQAVLDTGLAGFMRLQPALPPLEQWPVDACAEWLERVFRQDPSVRARVIVSGPSGSGRRTFAAAVAARIKLSLFVVDADSIPDSDWRSVFVHAQRQAFLASCAIAWIGESLSRRHGPQNVVGFPVQFVVCESGQEPPPVAGFAEHQIRLNVPRAATRAQLWRLHVRAAGAWSESDVATLAGRHRTQPGDIASVGRSGVSTPAEAAQAARELARGRLATLTQQLECPFTWSDLVVPATTESVLRSIAYEAEQRTLFWEQAPARRLFPQGQGLLTLFSGHPGTGKTMAAQVIAAHLGQDLFRVNLAQYVSKWVGETAKHCEQLLNQAAEMDAVLFFDEADAIFAKRSAEMRDAQDRFANTDAAHLLQAIEGYRGVAFLATNLKGNIDPAFFRRLRYVVEFAKPDAAQRRQLWHKLMLELAGEVSERSLEPVLDAIAASVESTAAQTKYALLGALFAARRESAALSSRHLLLGLENELGKEGRSIGPRDREKILKSDHSP